MTLKEQKGKNLIKKGTLKTIRRNAIKKEQKKMAKNHKKNTKKATKKKQRDHKEGD